MIKKISLLLIFFVANLFLAPVVWAQNAVSNCVVTKVGLPGGLPNLPPSCKSNSTPNNSGNGVSGSCGTVVDWAAKITPNLTIGSNGYYSVSNAEQTSQCYTTHSSASKYWCTDLVIDSYNLSGIQGLSVANGDEGVLGMHAHFRSLPGYFALDGVPNQDALQKVKPGFAIFYRDDEHVEVVKSISLDDHGNGTLETYASNSSATSHTWTVAEWSIQNVYVNGFGGHE